MVRGGSAGIAAALMAVTCLGCEQEPRTDDAGPVTVDGGAAFVEPLPPEPPSFGPCPDGWEILEIEAGVEVCEPPAPIDCPAGAFQPVGSSRCAPVGEPCPPGEWAEPPSDAGAIVYVRAGAADGDGTMERPYGSIQDAIARSAPGATILVGKGTYEEAIELFGGTIVRGACALETILAPVEHGPFVMGAVNARELGAQLSNVTIRPVAALSGVYVTGELELRGAIVEGATDDAVFVREGGALSAEELVVRDTVVQTPQSGRCLAVERGTVEVRRGLFERCPGAALLASDGATLVAREVRLRASGGDILGGPQAISQLSGVLELHESVVEDAEGAGLFGTEGGTHRVDQVVIRRMTSPGERGAAGAFLRSGSRLQGRRLRVVDGDFAGLVAVEEASLEVEDLHVARIRAARLDGVPTAVGLIASSRGLTVRRARIEDVDKVGVQLQGVTGSSLEDVDVVGCGGLVDTEHASAGIGLTDVQGTLRRVRVRSTHGGGITAAGSNLILQEVRVSDILAGRGGRFGRGIELGEGHAVLSRVLVERTGEVAVHSFRGASLELSDVRVLDTRGRECASTTCADAPGGLGLAAVGGAITARSFEVDGARLCGVLVSPGGELDLRDGQVAAASVGACLQIDGYDVTRVTDGVAYRDNGINVDATRHELPGAGDPLQGIDL